METFPGIPRCPVCYDLIREPVVLPCKHEACLACFTKSLDTGNLCCPLCRKRISSWARRHARDPVCSKRKQQIERILSRFDKENVYPVESAQGVNDTQVHQHLSKPGEIKEEYVAELQKMEIERKKEEQLGEAVARQLDEEERKQQLSGFQQVKFDEEMADVLSQDFILNQIVMILYRVRVQLDAEEGMQQKQVEKDQQLARKLTEGSRGVQPFTSRSKHKAVKRLKSPSVKPITFWLRPVN